MKGATMNKSDKPRWKSFGFTDGFLSDTIKAIDTDLVHEGVYADRPEDQIPGVRYSDAGRRADLFANLSILQLYHLQYEHSYKTVNETLLFMSNLIVDYLLGDWRQNASCLSGWEGMTRDECRNELGWIDQLREGLVAIVLSQDNENLRKACEYPDEDLFFDEGSWDRTKDDNTCFIVLARYIRDKSLDSSQELVARLEKCRRKRPKLFIAVLKAISEHDKARIRATIMDYMKQYVKVELDKDVSIIVSIDGSILWNLAVMQCGELEPLDQELMDLIITQESLGLNS
ncbi:hypothetical protein [Gimesia maris]|uniref:hypothetical protein n=1 Tax=Gimesia maris TaxID=122 RepID=UPI0032EC12C2